jgi:hypothetical protein
MRESMLQLRLFADNVDPIELDPRLQHNKKTHPPDKSHILHLFSKLVPQGDIGALMLSLKVILHDIDSCGQTNGDHRI